MRVLGCVHQPSSAHSPHTFVDMRIIAYNKDPNNNTRSVLLTWRGVRDWAANEYSSGVMEASSTSQARGVVAASTDRE